MNEEQANELYRLAQEWRESLWKYKLSRGNYGNEIIFKNNEKNLIYFLCTLEKEIEHGK